MIRALAGFAAVLSAAAFVPAAAHMEHRGRRDPGADRQAILALEKQWLAGLSDRATLERVLADDFVHPLASGVVATKAQHIAWAVSHPRPAGQTAHFQSLDVKLLGDVAIATGVVDVSALRGGEPHRTIFTDVFAFRSGAWRAVSAQETAIQATR